MKENVKLDPKSTQRFHRRGFTTKFISKTRSRLGTPPQRLQPAPSVRSAPGKKPPPVSWQASEGIRVSAKTSTGRRVFSTERLLHPIPSRGDIPAVLVKKNKKRTSTRGNKKRERYKHLLRIPLLTLPSQPCPPDRQTRAHVCGWTDFDSKLTR